MAAIVVFLGTVNAHYAIANWLVWHYVQAIVLALAWGVPCLSFGFFLLDRVRAQRDSVFRDAVLAFPLGVLAFQLAIFLLGILIQGLMALLIAAQVLWGGDVPFFPTHNLIHDSQLRMVVTFLASGFRRTPNRFRLYGDESLVDAVLPRDANVLLHEMNPQLGIDVLTVNDQRQGLLSYGTLGSPAAIHKAFANLKITHLVWNPTQLSPWNSIGGGLAFINYAANFTVEQIPAGQYRVGRFVPERVPTAPFNDLVAVMDCGNPSGRAEAPLADELAAVAAAGFLVIDPGCHATLPAEVGTAFQPPTSWNGRLQLYVRRPPGDAPAP